MLAPRCSTAGFRSASPGVSSIVLAGAALVLPACESRVDHATSRLDEIAPVWQFREAHTIRIAPPPSPVYDAIKRCAPTWS